jgi:crotonobetainyl-CoA:carnitine CoA-transferase CaiB-like acyl-CoA transferase
LAGSADRDGLAHAPDLGEHTEEVLAEIGLEATRRAELRERGVIR